MVRFAICDDQPFMVRQLSGLLSDYMGERPLLPYDVGRFEDGESLLESGGGFDLIFLDIQMERPDGMETARRLRRQGEKGLVVFVTAFGERVFEAFEVEAYDYLVKPLSKERFRHTMDRAMERLEGTGEKGLVIQKGNSCQILMFSEILYCEVWGRKVYVHEKNGNVTEYYQRMDELEKRVDRRFFRCHRSYLVNLDYVRGCKEGEVFLAQGGSLPVSRKREKDFVQAVLRHMKERGR